MGPVVANAFHDMLAILFMLLTCGTTLAALGLDIFRLRLLVVKSGTMITVDRPGRGSQILTGVTFTLCLGAAFVAALFGGRSRSSLSITGSMVLWCIALVSELVIPVWTLMSRTTRSVGRSRERDSGWSVCPVDYRVLGPVDLDAGSGVAVQPGGRRGGRHQGRHVVQPAFLACWALASAVVGLSG